MRFQFRVNKVEATLAFRAGEGNRPGRHTLGLDRAQQGDRWRDDGGEA